MFFLFFLLSLIDLLANPHIQHELLSLASSSLQLLPHYYHSVNIPSPPCLSNDLHLRQLQPSTSKVTLWTWPYWLPLWNLKTFILAYQHFIFTHLSSSAASINFPYSISFPVQTRNIVYHFTCSLASTLTTTINDNDGTWNFFPLSWVISLSLMLQWNNSKYLPFNLFQWKDFTHLPFCLQACWPYSPWVSSVLPGKLNVFFIHMPNSHLMQVEMFSCRLEAILAVWIPEWIWPFLWCVLGKSHLYPL